MCLLLGALLQAAAPKRVEQRSVAIHPLQPLGTEPQIARRLEDLLHAQVTTIPGVKLLSQDAMNAFLLAQPTPCDGGTACLVKLGEACGVQKLVYGTVASLGDSYVLDLKLIDVATRKEANRQSVSLSGEQAVLIDGIRAAAVQLIAKELYVGSITLRLDKPGAQVFVDGKLVGSTPLPPIPDLEPGKHALKIVMPGYTDFDQFVDVRFERTTLVNISLKGTSIDATVEAIEVPAEGSAPAPVLVEAGSATPRQAGLMESPLFLAGLGTAIVGALGLVGGGFAMIGAASSFQAFNDLHAEDLQTVEDPSSDKSYTVLKDVSDERKNRFDKDYTALVENNLPLWYGGQIGMFLGGALLLGGAALMVWDVVSRPAEVELGSP
ncbi:MAG: PEGA domain-containing protein [Pseudomonadota bacterium]